MSTKLVKLILDVCVSIKWVFDSCLLDIKRYHKYERYVGPRMTGMDQVNRVLISECLRAQTPAFELTLPSAL